MGRLLMILYPNFILTSASAIVQPKSHALINVRPKAVPGGGGRVNNTKYRLGIPETHYTKGINRL